MTRSIKGGSSPLARGTQLLHKLLPRRARLIPARAGNTQLPAYPDRSNPAHPRSRGEHSLQLVNPLLGPGSSPLARGTRDGRSG